MESTNIISKEQVINNIITSLSTNLNQTQIMQVITAMSASFEHIDFVQQQNMLSTEVIDNLRLMNIFMAVKKINGCKESTINAYVNTVREFDEYCKVDFKKIETNHIRCYLLEKSKTCSKSSVNNLKRNLNTFFQFMVDDGYITKNPCVKIPSFKEEVKHKHWLTQMEVEFIRDSCQTKREIALVDLLLSTGIRVGEVTNIRLSDINWDTREIVIKETKSGKDRIAFMSTKAYKHVKEYVLTHRYHTGYLFEPQKWNHTGKVSNQTIEKELHAIGARCNLEFITVHYFRRYFASDLQSKGVEPSIIQELMGHASFSTTHRYYLKQDKTRLKRTIDLMVA